MIEALDGPGSCLETEPEKTEDALDQRKKQGKAANKPVSPLRPGKKGEPDWAAGLRQLYNSVLDEPLPDSFDKLLKKLDEDDGE